MSNITKKSRDFTKEEKLAILKEGAENGIKPTLAKHNLLPATYYYWKRTLQEEPLSVVKAERKLLEKQLKELQTENQALKLMLAEEQLKSRLKSELLKKKRSASTS